MEKNPVELFEMEVAHIGINAAENQEAEEISRQFLTLMGLPLRETPISLFAGDLIEVMRQGGRGEKGHIGFRVNDCEAALKYFAARGLHLAEETKQFDGDGRCRFCYFQEEIGGFAIHLVQR